MSDDWRKNFIYLRGFADGAGLEQTKLMLQLIEVLHEGQKRGGGLPYASHPVMCVGHATSLGITYDDFLAGLGLHDVFEDTNYNETNLLNMGFSRGAIDIAWGMTRLDGMTDEEYFGKMTPWVMLGKIFDRFHNMSTLTGVFKPDRARRFIDETKKYIYPMFKVLKKCPEVISLQQLYSLKYALEGLVDSIEVFYPEDDSGTQAQ